MSAVNLLRSNTENDAASTASQSNRRFYDAVSEGASSFVTRPVHEVQETVSEFLLVRLYWGDMERRERTIAHRLTLVVGVVQFFVVLVYIALLEFNHHGDIDYRFLNFIVMDVFIASACQMIYSVRGICLENSPMLLIANINSVFLAIRVGLTVMMNLQARSVDATFSALFALLTVVQVASSYTAWGGEFNRFMGFCIGADSAIQGMFRQYQMMSSIGALDMQLCIMTAAAVLFFVETHAWHYILVCLLTFINLALHSLIRNVIRTERLLPLLAVIPYDIAYVIFLIFATYSTDVLGSEIEQSCFNTATFSVVVFCIVRLSLFGAIWMCTRNFGKGMTEAFQNQKSSREFILSLKRRYKPMFLPKDAPMTQV